MHTHTHTHTHAHTHTQAWAGRLLAGVLFNGRPLELHHEYELEVALQVW